MTKKIKVLFHTPDLSRKGGVSTFCKTISGYFESNVDYFASGARGNSASTLDTLMRMTADYLRYPFILLKGGYDIIQINPSLEKRAVIRDGVFILIAKCLRKKVVVFLHGWNRSVEKELAENWLWCFQRSYFLSEAFIVLAAEFKKRLQFMGYTGPIYIGRTAIENALLSHSTNHYLSRTSPDDPFHILFLTRIEKEKGIFEALEAFALLKTQKDDIQLTVAGDGTFLESAKKFVEIRKLPDVHFVGFVTDEMKAKVFQSVHCYLFPSYYEGMPISILEAMAFGLPIVTRRVGALADFFENGIMGYMTESYSPEILANLVMKLIDKPAECDIISNYNRKYAMKRFNALSVASDIEAIYSTIVA